MIKQMEPLIKPYNDLLTKIVKQGVKTDCTYALYNEKIKFNVSSLNEDYRTQLFIPYNRGLKKGSLGYGVAEAIWYRRKTQDPKMISNFAKIWNQMTDEKGLVQSNYGYQLFNNNDIEEFYQKLKEFIINTNKEFFVYDLFIVSQSNQHNRNDLVCNNKIRLIFERDIFKNHIHIKAEIIARSIDVIYGLPYDLFTAHGFLAMIKEKINELLGFGHTTIEEIEFNIMNVHWYFRDQPTQESLNHLSNKILCLDNDFTPYTIYLSQYSIDRFNLDEIKEQREIAKQSSLVIDQFIDTENQYKFNTSHNSQFNIVIKNKNILNDLDEINNNIFIFNHKEDIKRAKNVVNILKKNMWDRKTLILTKDNKLNYIMYNGDDFIFTNVSN